ncbi:receptor-type tyrosine-protein phosphatase F-like [Rhipicephalus sanguineus]|uniref:receptor-type tyrosine-protein phosphatase F-like n=1 Tax=Rhipicephalus sanguineus TaxID=34632 RepID=UPI001895AF4F|nr:receptor-type tyrosine-protein phosphatase F-like [Rhipicephalus sanguineus]
MFSFAITRCAGSLHISDAQEEDQGRYECVAENSVGTAISPFANLLVRAVRRVAPYFAIPPESTYEVSPGAALNLTCVAVGSPMPYMRWRKGGVDLTADGEDVVSRSVLVLENVRESANYTCVASSSLGVIEHDSQVIVQEDDDQPQSPTYSQVRDAWADFDNRTDQNATTTVGLDSAALSAAVLGLSVPAANDGDHVPAESGTTPAEAAVLTGRLSSPQKSAAEEADATHRAAA